MWMIQKRKNNDQELSREIVLGNLGIMRLRKFLNQTLSTIINRHHIPGPLSNLLIRGRDITFLDPYQTC
jgi:hypothetical protein